MIQYGVVVANDLEFLKAKVEEKISFGWKPQGGVSVTHSLFRGRRRYYQAMIREAPAERGIRIEKDG